MKWWAFNFEKIDLVCFGTILVSIPANVPAIRVIHPPGDPRLRGPFVTAHGKNSLNNPEFREPWRLETKFHRLPLEDLFSQKLSKPPPNYTVTSRMIPPEPDKYWHWLLGRTSCGAQGEPLRCIHSFGCLLASVYAAMIRSCSVLGLFIYLLINSVSRDRKVLWNSRGGVRFVTKMNYQRVYGHVVRFRYPTNVLVQCLFVFWLKTRLT